MADTIPLAAEPRPGNGKGEARALRNQGRVPAVAYGSELESTPIHVDAKELRHALNTDAGENAILDLKIGEEQTTLAMAREVHRHPLRRHVLHLDFVTIDAKTAVVVEVPLLIEGKAPEGAIVNQPLNVLTIEVLPLEVPDSITCSIEGLEVGDVIRVGEIDVPEGVTLLDDAERTAVSVTTPDTEPAPEAEEDGEEDGEGAEADGEEAADAGAGEDSSEE